MSATDLLGVLWRKAFEPFRIVTSDDGTSYDIRHPDLVWVTLSTAHIGFPDQNELGVPARYDIVGLRHIFRLEQLAPLTPAAMPPSEE
jgi:hypothetical protein